MTEIVFTTKEATEKGLSLKDFLHKNKPSEIFDDKISWIKVENSEVRERQQAKRWRANSMYSSESGNCSEDGSDSFASANFKGYRNSSDGETILPGPLAAAWMKIVDDYHKTGTPITQMTINKLSKMYGDRTGKWCIFSNTPGIDKLFAKVAKLVVSGVSEAFCCKVSTVRPSSDSDKGGHVICLYTPDFINAKSVWSVRNHLRRIGLNRDLSYKADIYSVLGLFKDNPYGIDVCVYRDSTKREQDNAKRERQIQKRMLKAQKKAGGNLSSVGTTSSDGSTSGSPQSQRKNTFTSKLNIQSLVKRSDSQDKDSTNSDLDNMSMHSLSISNQSNQSKVRYVSSQTLYVSGTKIFISKETKEKAQHKDGTAAC